MVQSLPAFALLPCHCCYHPVLTDHADAMGTGKRQNAEADMHEGVLLDSAGSNLANVNDSLGLLLKTQ